MACHEFHLRLVSAIFNNSNLPFNLVFTPVVVTKIIVFDIPTRERTSHCCMVSFRGQENVKPDIFFILKRPYTVEFTLIIIVFTRTYSKYEISKKNVCAIVSALYNQDYYFFF